MARLVCTKGQFEGQHFPIDRGLTIGRAPHNAIQLDKTRGVSRDHCKVWKLGHKQFACADVGSTNGTLVNDGKTPRANLEDGDTIQVGECIFRFEWDQEEKPKPTATPKAESGEPVSERDRLAAMLRGESKPAAASSGGGGAGMPGIEVKSRILQYNKKDNSSNQLSWDMGQLGGVQKLVMWVIGIAVFVGLFLVVKGMMN